VGTSVTTIGIVGRIGSGKSTVAARLNALGWTTRKFATPLKNMLRSIGLNEREIEGDLKEKPCATLCGKTPRFAMLTLGTEWGRNMIAADFWVQAAMRQARGECVVFDDCRFPNEAAAIKARGGTIVLVRRPLDASEHEAHQSESEQDLIVPDYIIENNADLAQLEESVNTLVDVFDGRIEGWGANGRVA
jgi:hypothetical protein